TFAGLGLAGAGLFGLAKGGPARGGRPYIVGERGPELFVPKRDGVVIPNHMLQPQSRTPQVRPGLGMGPSPMGPNLGLPGRAAGGAVAAGGATAGGAPGPVAPVGHPHAGWPIHRAMGGPVQAGGVFPPDMTPWVAAGTGAIPR